MRLGIIGCGAIGSTVAKAASQMPEVKKIKLLDKDTPPREALAKAIDATVYSPDDVNKFLRGLDLVIEAASQEAVAQYGITVLRAGCDLMVLSVGALGSKDLFDSLMREASKRGLSIYVPSGAVAGMDGVFAAAQAGLGEVTLVSTKPPEGFKDAPYLIDKGIDLKGIVSPKTLFEGPASEAVKAFPKNVNVAATLSLCGLGLEGTNVRIVADPEAVKNKHEILAKGAFGELRVEVQNVPSPQNPRTSYLAALSAIGCLKKIISGVWVGV